MKLTEFSTYDGTAIGGQKWVSLLWRAAVLCYSHRVIEKLNIINKGTF
jgi:hypothetical protein